MVRLEEIRQSIRIVRQCAAKMPKSGPIDIDDPRVVLPAKNQVYTTIEGTIQHFKIVMEGSRRFPPAKPTAIPRAATANSDFTSLVTEVVPPTAYGFAPPAFTSRVAWKNSLPGR